MDNKFFNFEKPIKKLANIGCEINIIVNYHKHKIEAEYDHKKRIPKNLNEIRQFILDLNTYHETVFKLTEKCQPKRLKRC